MNYLLIPDKFKDSLTAFEVIESISNGIRKVDQNANIHSVVASDGGDGFLEAILNTIAVEKIPTTTVDPISRPIEAFYLLSKETDTAYIELAKASGLELLKEEERKVMNTSTFGTGLQIKDAVNKGVKTIYIGLGGSATNDAGMGIAKALGYSFSDKDGNEINPIGCQLANVFNIEKKDSISLLNDVSFFAVNDVDNPLFGMKGAAHVYAKQKGANTQEIAELNTGLKNIHSIAVDQLQKNNAHIPGAGAAGGTAYGLKTFLNADYINGVEFLIQLAKVPQLLKKHAVDLIITGEGKIDSQTIHGKLVKGVLHLGQKFSTPVIAVCGKLDLNKGEIDALGLEAILEVKNDAISVAYSMEHASGIVEKLIGDYLKVRFRN